ncbi:phage tail protein [Dokdonia ponticola]|uniref:Phage tail protein n=1 Tax=Dokdonia ponticola TaxID=2041041 RepID=A0ABV9HSD9_9FLAO
MKETHNPYPVRFYFSVSFDGSHQADFQEVAGISKEMHVEDVNEGGENRFNHKIPPSTSSQNLILKRGFISKNSSLFKWCVDSIDDGLATAIQTKNITVHLLDSDGVVKMTWIFYNAYPVRYSVADLKSQENNIAIETLELAYTYFQVDTI